MYNKVHDKVFEALMTVALDQIIYEEDESCPSDEKLAKMYPTSKKMMRKYRNKVKERWYRNPLPVVYLKRVSIIALAVISVMFGVLSTSGEVRAAIVNTVVTWHDKYVNIDLYAENNIDESESQTETEEGPDANTLVVGYIPQEYILSSSTEEIDHREYLYMTDTGEYLLISFYSSKNADIGLDIQNSEYEQFVVNGNDAFLSYNDTDQYGTIVFGNRIYTVTVSGLISKDELIKISENIK